MKNEESSGHEGVRGKGEELDKNRNNASVNDTSSHPEGNSSSSILHSSLKSSSLKEKTAKGLLWGGFSNGMQQLLNLLFGILLARLLDDSDYGMVGMLTIFTAIAGTLQESGFTAALANRKQVEHRDYNAVFWFSTLMGAGMYIVLFFCAPLIAQFYDAPELTPLARFVFLGFLISSTGIAHHAYLFRNLMVKQKAMSQVPALFISGCVGVLMAWHGMSYWGIATQTLTFILLTNLSYWYFSSWRPTLPVNFRPLRKMFGFSSKLLVTNIFLQVNNNLLSTLLGRFFTPREVGQYTQANKWNTIGYSLISGMISSVAQPVLTEVSQDAARQLKVFRKMLRFAAFLSFPALLGLALTAEELITIAITDKWLPCVPILQVLCVWGAFMPIITLYTNLIISKGKSNVYMWNTIALSLLQLAAMLVTYPRGLMPMVTLFAGIHIGWLLVWQFFVHRIVGLSLWMALKDVAPFAFIALCTTALAWYVTKDISNLYLSFALKVLTGAAAYILLMWLSHARIFRECLMFIRKKDTMFVKSD